ncbi:hypothetical protein [Brevibacillus centrosporus]|uniref:hypothetical protein n=1 Tax=Brevibacillus centrosporus TaxID=54910 RepID=UPI003B01B316
MGKSVRRSVSKCKREKWKPNLAHMDEGQGSCLELGATAKNPPAYGDRHGIDGETLADIEKRGEVFFLHECQRLLKEGNHHPQPVKRQYIPKKDGKQLNQCAPVAYKNTLIAYAFLCLST